MFDEPEQPEGRASESAADPAVRAREKADELALHAELAAVFEGPRKFDAEVLPMADAGLAREAQQAIGRLEKAKTNELGPILPPTSADAARAMLTLPRDRGLSPNDYHVNARPGETIILRWLDAGGAEAFYGRMQAHFDAALNGYREDERSSTAWRGDPATLAYLDALDKTTRKMSERYLRDLVAKHGAFLLSTFAVDEMDVLHLCDHLMNTPSAEVVGVASAPPADDPSDADRAWFFKLFALRGRVDDAEMMCFFTYLQKSDDSFDF